MLLWGSDEDVKSSKAGEWIVYLHLSEFNSILAMKLKDAYSLEGKL